MLFIYLLFKAIIWTFMACVYAFVAVGIICVFAWGLVIALGQWVGEAAALRSAKAEYKKTGRWPGGVY